MLRFTAPKQRDEFIKHRKYLHFTCNMILPRNTHKRKKVNDQLRDFQPALDLAHRHTGAFRILVDRQKARLNNIVVRADGKVDQIIIYTLFFTMLDGKLEHFDLLMVLLHRGFQNDSFKIIERRIFRMQQTKAGEPPVAVNDSAVGKHDAGFALIHERDVIFGLFHRRGVAGDDKALDGFVILLPIQSVKCRVLRIAFVLGDPGGDAVVLVVIIQQVEPDAIYRVGLRYSAEGEFSG